MATALIPSDNNTYRSATFTVAVGTPRKLTLVAPSGIKLSPDAQALLYTVNSSGSETYTGLKLSGSVNAPEQTSMNVVASGNYKIYLYATRLDAGVDID